MNQAEIQAKVNRGLGIAANILGASYTQYRPTDPLNPLSNPLGTVMADFDINPKFSYAAPAAHGKVLYYGLFDGTQMLVGDYLIGPQTRTFFVANMEPNRPPLCVECNATVTFQRPLPQPVGPGFYGGDIRRGGETLMLAGWPASVLQGVRGEKGPAGLPGDTRMPWANVLAPAFPGVDLQAADLMSDDIGRTFILSSVELTELGWRITAILADT